MVPSPEMHEHVQRASTWVSEHSTLSPLRFDAGIMKGTSLTENNLADQNYIYMIYFCHFKLLFDTAVIILCESRVTESKQAGATFV